LQLRDIELYAAANGPGSFTGIRVGLAAAMAWARAFERPVIGVSVLEAMLYKAQPASDWTFPAMDAGRGEFYVASFRRTPSDSQQEAQAGYESVDQGWLFKPESLRTFIAERIAESVTASCIVRARDNSAVDFQASLPASITPHRVEGILVETIAAIALKQAQSSDSPQSAKLDAYYLRRPDAEMNWKE
jgi:tRNA threonylcarbamoyladenosine biosynthesis protein TsaB